MSNKTFFMVAGLVTLIAFESVAFAKYTRGYTKKNGTYVSGYNRSSPNNRISDNYSYSGNTNPYTGSRGYKTSRKKYW